LPRRLFLLVHIEDAAPLACAAIPPIPSRADSYAAKVAQYLEREYSPAACSIRKSASAPKVKGRFTPISWEEALDTISRRLAAIAQEHGSESILPYSYAGTMGLLNNAGMDRRFFHRLGRVAPRPHPFAPAPPAPRKRHARTALFHRTRAVPRRETHHRLGREYSRNQRAPVAFHCRSAAQGAKLYVIDPVKTPHRCARRSLSCHQSRQRSGAGAGPDPCDRGENLHDTDYIARYTAWFR